MYFFFIIVLLTIQTSVSFLFAQEIKLNLFNQKKFADTLYQKKEYYRSISEYKRLLYFYPNYSDKEEIQLKIGKAYLAGGDYNLAIDYWQNLFLKNQQLNRESKRLYVISLLDKDNRRLFAYRQENVNQAISILKQIKPSLALDSVSFIKNWENRTIATKSPLLAGSLSALIPGVGSIYINRPKEAFYSFFITSLFIAATLESQKSDNKSQAVILGSISLAFYGGSIYTSVNGAYKYNDLLNQKYLNNLRGLHNLYFYP